MNDKTNKKEIVANTTSHSALWLCVVLALGFSGHTSSQPAVGKDNQRGAVAITDDQSIDFSKLKAIGPDIVCASITEQDMRCTAQAIVIYTDGSQKKVLIDTNLRSYEKVWAAYGRYLDLVKISFMAYHEKEAK